jgi:hypothetical protein
MEPKRLAQTGTSNSTNHPHHGRLGKNMIGIVKIINNNNEETIIISNLKPQFRSLSNKAYYKPTLEIIY